MKKIIYTIILLLGVSVSQLLIANEPDSAYIFSYTTEKHNNTAGLHYAWSLDKKNWHAIGPEWRFLFSDFGTWGSQKKMISPFVFKGENGEWHCIWTLNNEVGQIAHAATTDLYNWLPQSYPEIMENGNCQFPEAYFNRETGKYEITWISNSGEKTGVFKTTTKDFKSFTPTVKVDDAETKKLRNTVQVDGVEFNGSINKVSWNKIDALIKWHEWSLFHNQERDEKTSEDPYRFSDLKPVDASISIEASKSKDISDMLIGIFFEDINYAADGGIYAELIQNRGFEYKLSDRKGRDKTWNSKKAWSTSGENSSFKIDTVSPIHANNKHFAVLQTDGNGSLINEGFDGIPVKAGEKYNFSVFAKALNGEKSKLLIRIVDENGKSCGEAKTKSVSGTWNKYKAEITVSKTVNSAKLEVIPQSAGTYALDMISLFPQNTFKGRENGLRADLAQTIADIHPRFIRFPGGCVAHGDGLANMYRWKNTVGPLEARKPQRNIWNYHQTAGLGYYEYFQFCVDIGAEPLPVLPAGVPCQNSSTGGHGQQGGIPMCDMEDYVQEVLDLIEWANGDKNTKWGKIRSEAGHPEPFNLKYVGIGNEDLITEIFEERFKMIFDAVKEKYPDIIVIGTVGPFYTGSDYVEGWKFATELGIPMVDEHYYQPPGWFIHNQDYYDRYDRSKSKVYLGEYAAHLPGRPNNIETALSEALYLTSVERNGDIVHMTSYAPLLAKEGHTQWNPDLIYFNNTEVKPTVGYQVQKLYGQNSGDKYITTQVKISTEREAVKKRIAVSVVKDSKTNDVIIKLVNLLPVEVNANIDLKEFNISNSDAALTVLKGRPDDKLAKPETSSILVKDLSGYKMPPYSFSVIRINGE